MAAAITGRGPPWQAPFLVDVLGHPEKRRAFGTPYLVLPARFINWI